MAADGDDAVKGGKEILKLAEAGMKLFEDSKEEMTFDVPGATAFKEEQEAKIASLEAEAAALTGKDNKKARQEKDKQKAELKNSKEYIDACKVVKGLPPPNGNFAKVAAPRKVSEEAKAPVEEAAKPDAKAAPKEKAKKENKESAGISRAEKDELEKLKNDIIERKKKLKEEGMSGGQMNKDPEIVGWVARMNELKEKENPGALAAAKEDKKSSKKKGKLSGDALKQLEDKQKELQEYEEKLRTEFKYSKKEIAADPDYKEMKAAIAALEK